MVNEKRIKAITKLYYSNPQIHEALLNFARDRETVPSYMMESFGKRPDMIQYASDIDGLVKKGATSFHTSEELWTDPLSLSPELGTKEINKLRKGWDLLIDIDSKYLDISKLLAGLLIDELERNGVKNYGIKFSGSKGFHLIVSGKAFPRDYNGKKMNEMFPEWPRAICEYLMHSVRRDFNKKSKAVLGDEETVKKRTGESKDRFMEVICPNCGKNAKKGSLIVLRCPVCKSSIQRKDVKKTKKRLKCMQADCPGILEVIEEKEYFKCENCNSASSINKKETSGRYATTFTKYAQESDDFSDELEEEFAGSFFGASDLVLVAPRHLFRMPYSLHEKTALASIVIGKNEIADFVPARADPFKIKIKEFLPKNVENEAERLLAKALEWKQAETKEETENEIKKYQNKEFNDAEMKNVTDDMFPEPIKKLLKGLEDGRKRGLFVLLTFFRAVGFSPEEISKRVREWNEKNSPPLREGYVKSQIAWHLRQKKRIIPPNYSNEAFYRDIGLLDKKPTTKNPLVDVRRKLGRRQEHF